MGGTLFLPFITPSPRLLVVPVHSYNGLHMEVPQPRLSTLNAARMLAALSDRRALFGVALAVVFAVAVGLRFYGLNWDDGYDWTPHPDERAILMMVGELSPPAPGSLGDLLNADESPWNPRWFPYGSLALYLLKGVQLAYNAWPGAELHDLRVAGRVLSALADLGTLVLVYVLGSRIYGRREGLLAATLLALAVLHIQLSHFYAVDTMIALFAIATLFFLYRVASTGRTTYSVLAGVCIGLGLATKVSLAPIIIPFATAHLLYWMAGDASDVASAERLRRAIRGVVVGAVVSAVAFVVAEPYALLDWSRFFADFTEQSEMVRRIRDYPYTRQYIDTTPYFYQARQLAAWGLGWPLGIVAWVSLAYAALRGLRLQLGLMYLAFGWGVPIGLLLVSNSVPAILLASAIAFAALLATVPVRSADSRVNVILLSWVVPYLLLTGSLEVKFLRYLIPVTPVLVLFTAQMLFAFWGWASDRTPTLKPWLMGGLAALVGVTGFYALSYMAVFSQPHTAVRTAEWINANADPQAIILREHWEEGIPNLHGYEFRELPLYENDGPQKVDSLSRDLAEADYVVFYSNRLYGTIPRLPERYPQSREYYRLLFSGGLGYELANVETAYPKLLGVSLVHDTFGRPELPVPQGLDQHGAGGLVLNLGFADESFSVYDHPTGMVFRNADRLDAATIRSAIEGQGPGEPAGPPDARVMVGVHKDLGLLMSPADAEAQRSGGTWTDIVRPDSWASRLPVIAWLLVVESLALIVAPLAFVVFRPLPDRGFLFSKALGLLSVSLLVWLMASTHWMAFSRASIAVAVAVVAAVSVAVLARNREQMIEFVRRRWSILLIGEAIFLIAFLAFVLLRMANPDLWHPFRGGEKPMDLAYLNAVLRSSYMPPYDPWFSGGFINYYYYGQFMVATLIRATGIDPTIAYNLAVPLFFALTVGGAFSLVYNLAEGTLSRRRTSRVTGGEADVVHGDRSRLSPLLAGLFGATFVAVLGNLDGAIQVGHGIWRVWMRNMSFGEFDFWRSSRMMPPDPPGIEITEFPFFSFLFADLHAHMMALPFTVLALGVALAVVMGAARRLGANEAERGAWGADELIRLAALGVVVGALRTINTWDYPTYMVVSAAVVFLAAYIRRGGLGLLTLTETAAKVLVVFLVGYVAFLPFHMNYEAFFNSVESTTNQTVLWQFLAISGLFVFVIGSFLVVESRDAWVPVWRAVRGGAIRLARPRSAVGEPMASEDTQRTSLVRIGLIAAVALVALYSASIFVSGWTGSTIPFLLILEAMVLVVAVRLLASSGPETPPMAYVLVLVGVALALAIGLDIFRVEGDIDRMNTVFKVYLQVWVMLALASAYLLWRLLAGLWRPTKAPAWARKAWVGLLTALVVSASVYPVLGTQDRLRDRYDGRALSRTLDGLAYMDDQVYHDKGGEIHLSSDRDGIQWLQENLEGSPVVLEGVTPIYRWGGRVSIYSGLPTVVGWQWHQEQQRWGYRDEVGRRAADVHRMYNTADASEALSLMRQYGVEYVYVGELEHLYYQKEGLAKFVDGLGGELDQVYANEHVKIYHVPQG